MRRKFKVFIGFKSGKEIILDADEFTVQRDSKGLTKIMWEGINQNVLYMDVDEIIYVIGTENA